MSRKCTTTFRYRLARLIDVKSVITIAFSLALVIIVLRQMEVPTETFQLFSNASMLTLGFFFGKNIKDNPEEGD